MISLKPLLQVQEVGIDGGRNGSLIDSCLRHCLLSLVHLYVPMPGTAIPRSKSSVACFPCAGMPLRSRVLQGRNSALFRSVAAARLKAYASSRLDAVEHMVDDVHAARVLRHDRQPKEIVEIAIVLDIILQLGRLNSTNDVSMVRSAYLHLIHRVFGCICLQCR